MAAFQIELAADDIQAAIAYVRMHADDLSIDANRLALWAFSGGGSFLSLALREQVPFIRCLVTYYAILDLRPFQGGAGGVVTDAVLRTFSPVAYLEGGAAPSLPMLIARAGQDQPIRYNIFPVRQRLFPSGGALLAYTVAGSDSLRIGFSSPL